ncbi:PREDICTED: LOW QUALITY PROTEIN: transmembrane protein 141 [Mesitornis unicolor]|uniref:LOW QUALITY PROTEIN: transmembrane protein 141 n=1 Tax=Mesitornis unicolor TaxID=54374 RepID=UPI000528343B|nr:PREDICTED: LOW QUALITY PROTEIN: transmembrane protein 141 [Mesitornis unicolor]
MPVLWSILVSTAAGSLASYVVTRAETQKCSDFWIYLETGKTPQELAVASGASQPIAITRALCSIRLWQTHQESREFVVSVVENLPSPEDRESTAPLVRRNKYGDVVE